MFITPELLRRNVVTYLIGLLFFFALGHLIPDFAYVLKNYGALRGGLLCLLFVFLNVSIPYNIVLFFTENERFRKVNSAFLQVLIFSAIVLSSILMNGVLNYFLNASGRYLKYSIAWSFYISGFGTLIYLFLRQNEMEKTKKLFEKELELSRLSELKVKAELDALHAKINPHFLYNALNSLADLSLFDGQRARQMALSLADLFRYSINYTKSNYATVKDEIEMASLYLEIEKIRFEEKLNYKLEIDDAALQWEVPRFILQPVVENAVKHGLQNLDQTTIVLHIKLEEQNLYINVYDNGPLFPKETVAGYGLKSIFDKLDLLFPGRYEVNMHNEPVKNFEIILYKHTK